LTVEEQLLLRHGRVTAQQLLLYWYTLLYEHVIHHFAKFAKNIPLPGSIGERLESVLHALEPPTIDWLAKKKIKVAAIEFLKTLGGDASSKLERILDMTPPELSGGAKAIAKVLSSQLYSKPRVLILDEAFSGIQRNIWPLLVEQIKRYASNHNAAVLAISHNTDELAKWEPSARFKIAEGKLIYSQYGPRGRLRRGMPAQNPVFPVLVNRSPYDANFVKENMIQLIEAVGVCTNIVIITTSSLKDNTVAEDIRIAFQNANLHARIKTITIEDDESRDHFITFRRVTKEIIQFSHRYDTCAILVGGGVLLNIAGFIILVINRGRLRCVLVPSTVLSIADVALGGKTTLPFRSSIERKSALNTKHTIGTYFNPTAVVLDGRLLSTLPFCEIKAGLAECLKHGLLQDPAHYQRVAELLVRDQRGEDSEYMDVAVRTLELKDRVLEIDPWEENFGKLLLFGHLHAHSIERVTSYHVPHTIAVLLGMALELDLGGQEQIAQLFRELIVGSNLSIHRAFFEFDLTEMRVVYDTDNKPTFASAVPGKRRILRIPEIGYYDYNKLYQEMINSGHIRNTDPNRFANNMINEMTSEIFWNEIQAAYGALRGFLQRE
jgi:3-dehydroquinate synthetase